MRALWVLIPVAFVVVAWFVGEDSPTDVAGGASSSAAPSPTPVATTEPAPSPTPTPTMSAAPVPPLPDWLPPHEWEDLPGNDAVDPVLIANPIYAATFPVGACPAPTEFTTRDEHTAYIQSMLDCLQDLWQPYLLAMGITPEPIHLVPYDTDATSPCGSADPRFPAFYCSGNNTIYVSTQSYETALEYPMDSADTAIHEHVHHVQEQLGILDASFDFHADDLEISRRLELQDICMTSRLQLTVGDLGFDADNYDNAMWNFGRVGEEVHGSNESLTYWGNRGFYMPTIGGCNTWGVPADEVD